MNHTETTIYNGTVCCLYGIFQTPVKNRVQELEITHWLLENGCVHSYGQVTPFPQKKKKKRLGILLLSVAKKHQFLFCFFSGYILNDLRIASSDSIHKHVYLITMRGKMLGERSLVFYNPREHTGWSANL